MTPILSVSIQTLISLSAFFIAWRSWVSLQRTGDRAFKAFIWCFLLAGLHIFLYVVGIIHFSFYTDHEFLLLIIILSRALLYIGILFFIQSPIFMTMTFIKKNNIVITTLLALLIVIFSILHLITSPAPFVSEEGIIMENIQYLWVALLMILIPVGSSIVWIFSLIKILPKNASVFFKRKVAFLCLGIFLAATGNSIYILAKSVEQSTIGIGTVVFGYLLLTIAISMSEVRRMFFR